MRGEKMKESLRHKEVFEQYYIMGNDRSLSKLREKLMSLECRQDVVNLRTLQRWSKAFNWQERIEQRDIEVSRGLEIKTNETIINIKAGFKAEIKVQLSIFKFMLNKLIEKFKNDEMLEIKNLDNLKIVVDSYEKLIKLYLTLIGEASEIEEIELKDAKEKLISKINSIIAREKKTESLKRDKRSKRRRSPKSSI